MQRLELQFTYSAWWLLAFVLMGLGYAWVLYRRRGPWGRTWNNVLFALRAAAVFCIGFLLLSPLIRHLTSRSEAPQIVLAVDNSQSVGRVVDSIALADKMQQWAKQLADNNYRVGFANLQGSEAGLQNTRFNAPTTDLSQLLLGVNNNFENRNLRGVVLLTDGIVNQGVQPAYLNLPYAVHTLGVGDTVQKPDVALRNIAHNRIAYLKNKFPIRVEIFQKGFEGRPLPIVLKQGDKTLATQTVKWGPGGLGYADFMVTAERVGVQHYVIQVPVQPGETIAENNTRNIYIEVIDSREKILLAAASPHPDVKALKTIIEGEANFELHVFIPGISTYKEQPYDLIILHQLPDALGTVGDLVEKWRSGTTPIWYIAGSNSGLNRLATVNGAMTFTARPGATDRVTASYNGQFTRFQYEPENLNRLAKLPPLNVPYGNFALQGGAEAVLYQQVGSLVTSKPLLAIQAAQGRKTALLAGEGLWQWRLAEYAEYENHQATDELVRKVVKYLSSKDDKRRFRVYPMANEYDQGERPVFQAEVYNEIFERIYDQKVDLRLTRAGGKPVNLSFVTSESNSRMEGPSLPGGVYNYTATTTLNGKTEKAEGQFIIRDLALEAQNTTADWGSLRELSARTGGRFARFDQGQALIDQLVASKPKPLLRSFEELEEIINLPWLLAIILFLLSLEWFVRKYQGGY